MKCNHLLPLLYKKPWKILHGSPWHFPLVLFNPNPRKVFLISQKLTECPLGTVSAWPALCSVSEKVSPVLRGLEAGPGALEYAEIQVSQTLGVLRIQVG